MEFAIQSLVNSWVEKHPFLVWSLQHPIISLVSLFLFIVLLFRLFAAVTQLLDKLWIWLLKSPILLIRSLFGLKHKPSETKMAVSSSELVLDPAKISQIIQQLETINKQQQQIMSDIAALKENQYLSLKSGKSD